MPIHEIPSSDRGALAYLGPRIAPLPSPNPLDSRRNPTTKTCCLLYLTFYGHRGGRTGHAIQ